MKKFQLAILLAMCAIFPGAVGAADATFNAQTNILSIPTVNIGGVTYYNVNVLLNPSAFGDGWLTLPGVPDCMISTPVTCTDTQPQLISITISGPDSIPEGTSATYYAQSKWYWYSISDTKILHIITKGDSDLKISLSGSAAAAIDGTTVTAKRVQAETEILLSVYDSFNGVVASASKKVKITKVANPAPIISSIPGMRDLYPGSIFTLANGQSWILSQTSTCILPGPPVTSDNPKVTIYYLPTGTVMDVEGDPKSCSVEPLF